MKGAIFLLQNSQPLFLSIWEVFLLGFKVLIEISSPANQQFSSGLLQCISYWLISRSLIIIHILDVWCLFFFSGKASASCFCKSIADGKQYWRGKHNALGMSVWFAALHESDPKYDLPKAEITPLLLPRVKPSQSFFLEQRSNFRAKALFMMSQTFTCISSI